MVYNAMKLFMEINPQLFDDCSHEYTEQQNSAASRERARQNKWAAVADQAKRRKGALSNGAGHGGDVDPATEDNQKRLDSLKLDGGRRPATHERQASVGSVRSGSR